MLKPKFIPFAVGSMVAITLIIIWPFIDDHISLTLGQRGLLSSITLLVCPFSLMGMALPPGFPLRIDVAITYLTIIIANGLLYTFVAAVFRNKKNHRRIPHPNKH